MREITDSEQAVERSETYELEGLRTADGSRVVVLVLPLDALDMARTFKRLPGTMPQVGPSEQSGSMDTDAVIETIARPLVERCVHTKRDGKRVLAFSWSGESVLPANQLTAGDVAGLMSVAMRLSGLAGEQGDPFPVDAGEHSGGVGAIDAVVDAGQGYEPNAVAGM